MLATKRIRIKYWLTSLSLLIGCTCLAQPQTFRQIILLGIPGLTTETLESSALPQIYSLIGEGTINPHLRPVYPLNNESNWASLLSGTTPEMHGFNGLLPGPDIGAALPDRESGILSWLIQQKPVFVGNAFYDDSTLVPVFHEIGLTHSRLTRGERSISLLAQKSIASTRPNLLMIHFNGAVGLSAQSGDSPSASRNALMAIDEEAGHIIAETKVAGTWPATMWVVFGMPGLSGNESQTASAPDCPLIVCGPGIMVNHTVESPISMAWVAPLLANFLMVKPQMQWVKMPEGYFKTKGAAKPIKPFVPRPAVSLPSGTYTGTRIISIASPFADETIYYTLDGSPPTRESTRYEKPFGLSQTAQLKTVGFRGENASETVSNFFTFVNNPFQATLNGLDATASEPLCIRLFDGLWGADNPDNAQWVKFDTTDMLLNIDLGTSRTLTEPGIAVLLDPDRSCFLPEKVEFLSSLDNLHFNPLFELYPAENDSPLRNGPTLLSRKVSPTMARYIRVIAQRPAACADRNGKPTVCRILVSEVELH